MVCLSALYLVVQEQEVTDDEASELRKKKVVLLANEVRRHSSTVCVRVPVCRAVDMRCDGSVAG